MIANAGIGGNNRETREYVQKVESRMAGPFPRVAPQRPSTRLPEEITIDRWADGSLHVRN